MSTATLLVELLTEELPPKSLARLGEAFRKALSEDLVQDGFLTNDSKSRFYATPRRLAISISHVLAVAPDREELVKGPSVKAGLDDKGSATRALLGFAKKWGTEVDALIKISDGKQEVFAYRNLAKGSHLGTNLEVKVEAALKKLPVAKMMRWGDGDAEFVRPAHGLVMLHGASVVPGTVLGIASGNKTRGHRFMGQSDLVIPNAEAYAAVLTKDGMVIADFAQRRSMIDDLLQAEAKKQQATLDEYRDLLDEVTALVEHPSVYVGAFDAGFLEIPEECLILTMRQNQKYFPLFDGAGKLTNRFLIVSNMQVADPAHIINGNQRVIRPRLEDARFFYNQDRKERLETRVPRLEKVVYHNKLGTQLQRVERVQLLAGKIARMLNADAAQAERAAWLAKADLTTGMVGEFPELQGVMGRYYALHDGEPAAVADAIAEHYSPRYAGDKLPESLVACSVALADKMETLAGMFGIGQLPTGDKDPFGLRRQALGIIRILIERKLEISFLQLIDGAIEGMPPHAKSDWAQILIFIQDRARTYFSEQGHASNAIEAVLQPLGAMTWPYTLSEIIIEASKFIATEDGKILAEANKRITNILKKSGYEVPFGVGPDALNIRPDPSLFKDEAEINLWNALQKIGGESIALKKNHQFSESLRVLSQLGTPTKSFFESVMVNIEDPAIRDNRITLLRHARAYMNQVADLSLMAS